MKSMLMVVGSHDVRPLRLGEGEVECVIEHRGGVINEVGVRIAKASRALGCQFSGTETCL